MSEASQDSAASQQLLTFTCADVDYAVPILRIKEIIPYARSTRVPLAPEPIRGLINLRGHAIPVLDLAVRLGGRPTPSTRRTCVLIIDLDGRDARPEMGILTDSVARVVDAKAQDIERTPSFGMGAASGFLSGVLKLGGRFVPILDVDRVLAVDASLHALPPDEIGPAAAAAGGGERSRAGPGAPEPSA